MRTAYNLSRQKINSFPFLWKEGYKKSVWKAASPPQVINLDEEGAAKLLV